MIYFTTTDPHYYNSSLLHPYLAGYPLANKPSRSLSLFDDDYDWATMPLARSLLSSAAFANNDMTLAWDKDSSKYVVETQTPGVKRSEMKLEVVGGRTLELTIEQGAKPHAKDKEESESSSNAEQKPTVPYRYMKRSVVLPRDANTADMAVSYEDGVLRIELPRLEQAAIADGQKTDSIAAQPEGQQLLEDVKASRNKLQELEALLEAEKHRAAEAEAKLKEAQLEALKKKAEERTIISIQ